MYRYSFNCWRYELGLWVSCLTLHPASYRTSRWVAQTFECRKHFLSSVWMYFASWKRHVLDFRPTVSCKNRCLNGTISHMKSCNTLAFQSQEQPLCFYMILAKSSRVKPYQLHAIKGPATPEFPLGRCYESCRTEHQPPCDNSLCLRTYRQNEVLEEVLWVGPWYPDTSWKPYPATPAGSSKWEWISKTQKFTLDYQVFLGFRL